METRTSHRPDRKRTCGCGRVALLVLVGLLGCGSALKNHLRLPDLFQTPRGQLIVYSDFFLPTHHRLLEEMTARRVDLSQELLLPVSDEPIHIYLFETTEQYKAYMRLHFPTFPDRRAFFVETDTRLEVYAQWGDRVAEDLRHEVTHGYLHSVVPNLPLWLDEGLAEYYEVPRGNRGINRSHLNYLEKQLRHDSWRPDLARLDAIPSCDDLNRADYAESWAWVHFLLYGNPTRKALLLNYLRELHQHGCAEPLSKQLASYGPTLEEALAAHLWSLIGQMETAHRFPSK